MCVFVDYLYAGTVLILRGGEFRAETVPALIYYFRVQETEPKLASSLLFESGTSHTKKKKKVPSVTELM